MTTKNIKTITNTDAMNFPVVADFVGKNILSTEWYKAISGEAFEVLEDGEAPVKAEATDEAGAEVEAKPKKVAKKSK